MSLFLLSQIADRAECSLKELKMIHLLETNDVRLISEQLLQYPPSSEVRQHSSFITYRDTCWHVTAHLSDHVRAKGSHLTKLSPLVPRVCDRWFHCNTRTVGLFGQARSASPHSAMHRVTIISGIARKIFCISTYLVCLSTVEQLEGEDRTILVCI